MTGSARGRVPDHLHGRRDEAFGRLQVAGHAAQGVDQMAVGIDGAGPLTPPPWIVTYVSSACHRLPTWPRNGALSKGATSAAPGRPAWWLNTQPRGRNIAARSRRLSV
jgi:hypothetical protein